MIREQDMERVLLSALTHTFQAHGYDHEEAVRLAHIAVEPVCETMKLCQRLIETTIDAASFAISAQKEKPP